MSEVEKPEEEVKKAEPTPVVNEAKFTMDEVTSMVDSAVTKGIEAYKVNEAEAKDKTAKDLLVNSILANEKCYMKEETLQKLNVNELTVENERLGVVTPDFSTNAQAQIKTNENQNTSTIERAI